MLALLDAAVARGARLSTLEVRADNVPAQRLYRKLGYADRRPPASSYYRDGEDGLIMTTPAVGRPGHAGWPGCSASATPWRGWKLLRCFATASALIVVRGHARTIRFVNI